ncbi:MAG: LacI family transcriptional regulator, partial [Cellulomonadaceae bacterium]|nr:LacI family transcriptional regulator [Cellulomonadaceae bacterium]
YPLAAWLRPGLSTYAIPHEQLGRRAVELLLEAVHGGVGTGPGQVDRFPLPFISRGSVATRPV